MLVLVTFLAIGMAAVLLMLRFIFALDAEIKAAKRRRMATVRSISAHRSFSAAGARDPARVLTLAASNARRQAIRNLASRGAYFQPEKQSESKEA
jgi:hypothetical protein